ncbi:MAG: 6-bladed beta-propeller [Bacteroidota bacterium]
MFRSIKIFFLLSMLLVQNIFPQQLSKNDLVWPKPPQKARIKFLYSFSNEKDLGAKKSFFESVVSFLFGSKDKNNFIDRPQGITVDNSGRIFVADIGLSRIHIFDFENKKYNSIKDFNDSSFISPVSVAAANNNDIYICDSVIRDVFVYDSDLDFKYRLNAKFVRPTALRIENDLIYVTDTGANQVIVFDLKGKEKFRFGRNGTNRGEFHFPVHLAVLHNREKQGEPEIFVVDALNFRVQTFDWKGNYLNCFGSAGNTAGSFGRPKGIAVDSENHIYVADALLDIIQIFDFDGQLLLAFGGSGDGVGYFNLPTDLFIDKNDRIYVSDSGNHRIQVFEYLK